MSSFDAFALILALIALGLLLARARVLPDNAAESLNLFAIYLCLPAAVLRYVPGLTLDLSLIGLALTPWILMGATILLVLAVKKPLKLSRDHMTALFLCVGFCNSSFLGFPMTEALLGEDAVAYAVVYDQFGSFMLLSTVGLFILARHSGSALGFSPIFARMVRFPTIWALLIGLTIYPKEPPALLSTLVDSLAASLVPIVMVAIGLNLKFRMPREELAPFAFGLVARLVILPIIALGVGLAFGMPSLMLRVNILESAMPPMVTAAALAASEGIAPRLGSALVGYGLLLSIVTLPLITLLFEWAAL